jgi:hypothetical protein
MNDRIDRMLAKNTVERDLVPNVRLDERWSPTRDLLDAIEHHRGAVAQIVDDDRRPARGHQFDTGV